MIRHRALRALELRRTVDVGEDYRIAIPKAIAQAAHLDPGQRLEAALRRGRIVLTPLPSEPRLLAPPSCSPDGWPGGRPLYVVHPSIWLAVVRSGANVPVYSERIDEGSSLLVPSVSILEVYRQVLRDRGEDAAWTVALRMRQGQVVDLDAEIARHAACLCVDLRLDPGDAVMLATARRYGATLLTEDARLKGLRGVQYVRP